MANFFIKTIIFDIGGVIVNSFGKKLLDNASEQLNIEASELRKLMDFYEPDLQKGLISDIDFWKKIIQDKNVSLPPNNVLKKIWIEVYKEKVKINPEMIDFISSLKKNYIVGCVSNSIKPHTEFNKKRNLYKHFSPCVLSDKVGLRKPDEEIFRLYLKEANCQPNESIFIDDEVPMLENAKSIGINTILFKNIKQLKKELAIFKINSVL